MAWTIDTTHSHIGFAVRHMMISTVRGQFNEFAGNIIVDSDNLANSTVEGTIKAASIDTREANRDAHLRSPDFFDAETYPELSFRSTRIESKGDNEYKVHGDLTIRGVTRQVAFNVTDEGTSKDPWGNTRRGVTAETKINRSDFGLTWNTVLETGGFAVGDEVKITAELELVYQPEAVAVPA
jgi:polyisoprenoid-binding protein YceI